MRTFVTKISALLQGRKKTILLLASGIFWIAAIIYSFYMRDRLPYPDEQWYFNDYAQNLARLHIFSRDGITPTAFHPPAYSFFLALIVSLGLGITTARLMNFLAMFLTIICLFNLLEDQSHKLASILSVLLILGYPVLFYTAGTLYPQTFGALFFILAILLYLKEPLVTKNAILSGVSLGIAILTVPTFLFVPFFFVLFSMFIRKDIFVKTGLLFIMVFITIVPWTIRNYLVFNRFVLVSSNFGTNFLIGNSPNSTSNNGPAASVGITHLLEEANRLGLDEYERDKFYTKQALSFMQQNPKHYITLYFLKVANYFNFRNELLTASESSKLKDLIMLCTYGIFLLIAIFRILISRRYPLSKFEVFLILLYVGNAFVSALTFSRIRYRLPLDYLLIAFASLFMEKIILTKSHGSG
jgi:4-amino-4-deoxy-L-arabinose transferase-like glycosyltransferase